MEKDIELFSKGIMLRPHRVGDIESFFEAAKESVNEVQVWMPWAHSGFAREEGEKFINGCGETWDKGSSYDFAIIDSQTGQYVGGCGINQINTMNKMGNVYYWIRSSRTKQGIATLAARLVARWGIDKVRLNRIEIVAATGNIASQQVAEKAGAKREGILRNRSTIHENVYDAVMYSFIPQDLIDGH